jgi:hypothetical protein
MFLLGVSLIALYFWKYGYCKYHYTYFDLHFEQLCNICIRNLVTLIWWNMQNIIVFYTIHLIHTYFDDVFLFTDTAILRWKKIWSCI